MAMIAHGLGLLLVATLSKCAWQRQFGRKGIRDALTLEFTAGNPYSAFSLLQLWGLLSVAGGLLERFFLRLQGVPSEVVYVGEMFVPPAVAFAIAWIAMRRR